MKMKAEHYATLQEAINKFLADRPMYMQSYHMIGKSLKWQRWEVAHASWVGKETVTKWMCDKLYPYLNIEHVDTALRRIFNHKE